MFYPDIHTDIGLVYYAIYYDIMSVQIFYRFSRWRSVFVPDAQVSVFKFQFIPIKKNFKELFKRQLGFIHIQIPVFVVRPDKRIAKIP